MFSEGDLPIKTREVMHVSLPVYDGPLELLLELIKKNEMDIYNIQVSVITQQYLDSLAEMKQLDLEIAGEYLVLAATLLYIKSKMLLPQEEGDEEDEGLDPRAELVRKLLEYIAFKEAAKELGILEGERGKIFTRQISDYYLANLDPEDVGIDTFSASLFDLLNAFQGVMAKIARVQPHEVFEQEISIEEKMADLKALLAEKKKVVFSTLFQENWTRNLLIATFLAVLEIVRSRYARVVQEKVFGEIVIELTQTATGPQPQDTGTTT
jgi:segregation and condensation protein A